MRAAESSKPTTQADFRTRRFAGRNDPNVTIVKNANANSDPARRMSVHPFWEKTRMYSCRCRMSSITACPPGLRTRAISRIAVARPSAV